MKSAEVAPGLPEVSLPWRNQRIIPVLTCHSFGLRGEVGFEGSFCLLCSEKLIQPHFPEFRAGNVNKALRKEERRSLS